jgi:hypothetical protein
MVLHGPVLLATDFSDGKTKSSGLPNCEASEGLENRLCCISKGFLSQPRDEIVFFLRNCTDLTFSLSSLPACIHNLHVCLIQILPKTVTSIDLTSLSIKIGGFGVAMLIRHLPRLHTLVAPDQEIDFFLYLAKLSEPQTVSKPQRVLWKKLHLAGNPLMPADFEFAFDPLEFSELTDLDVSRSLGVGRHFQEILREGNFKKLKHFNMSDDLDILPYECMYELRNQEVQLVSLNISSTSLGPAGLWNVLHGFEGVLALLENFGCAGNLIDSEGLEYLTRLRSLRKIDMSNIKLSGDLTFDQFIRLVGALENVQFLVLEGDWTQDQRKKVEQVESVRTVRVQEAMNTLSKRKDFGFISAYYPLLRNVYQKGTRPDCALVLSMNQ